MDKKEVLFMLVGPYADWEGAALAAELNSQESDTPYTVKYVGLTDAPIRSIGGLRILPDYTVDTVPEDFAGLVLIGGESWRGEDAKPVTKLVDRALERKVPLGAICDATVFLGKNGYLNGAKHTSNFRSELKEVAGDAYTNEASYIREDAVRDGNLITANGQSPIAFGKLMLEALEAEPQEKIDMWVDFNTLGLIKAVEKHFPQN